MVKDIKDMTDEELAKLVKAHFLQYDNDRDAELNFLCEHPNRDMWDDEQEAEYDELMQMVRTGRTFYKEILNEVARRAHKSDVAKDEVVKSPATPDEAKLYAVDAYITCAKCFKVKAESKDDAIQQVEGLIGREGYKPLEEGFELGDLEEVRVSGEENEEGEIEYY